MQPRSFIPLLLLAIFIGGLVGCKGLPKQWDGHYVSDREATLQRWKETEPWGEKTAKLMEIIAPILGDMEMKMEGRKVTMKSKDWSETTTARVLSAKGNTVELELYSKVWGRDLTSRIEMDADGYWVYSDEIIKGYCERFSRKQ